MRKTIFIAMTIAGLYFLLMCLVSGCATRERCAERFPASSSDSVHEWVTYECDSFPIYIPYQELFFDTTGVIPPNIIFHHQQKRGHLTQTLDIRNGKITDECQEEAYRDSLQAMRATKHRTEQVVKLEPMPYEVKRWYDPLCRWWAAITIPLALLRVAWWLRKLFPA